MLAVTAGTALKLRVRLTPYQGRGATRTVDYTIRIPQRAHGAAGLTISGSSNGNGDSGGLLADHATGADTGSFPALLHQLASQPTNDTLTADLTLGATGRTAHHAKQISAVVTGRTLLRMSIHKQP